MATDRPLTSKEVSQLKPEPATEPPPAEERVLATAFVGGGANDPPPTIGSRITRVGPARGPATWQVDLITSAAAQPPRLPEAELFPVEKPKRPSRAKRD